VTISGVATTTSSMFASSYCYDSTCASSDCGFAVQDVTGAVWVSVLCPSAQLVAIGQQVIVSGLVTFQGQGSATSSMIAIAAADFPSGSPSIVLGSSTLVTLIATPVQISQVNGDSRLVSISGSITDISPIGDAGQVFGLDPSPCVWGSSCYGFKFWLTDGSKTVRVYVNAAPGTNFLTPPKIVVGDLIRVTGISGLYNTPELDVRSTSDLVFPCPSRHDHSRRTLYSRRG
jgi:hypothetical protein